MPEFEGTSESLSLQEALENAVRKAYTASERRTHTDPLSSYVVKRITGHLRTVTVVIETLADPSTSRRDDGPAERQPAPSEAPAAAAGRTTGTEPIRLLLDKQRRNEPLTANEQALLDLLRQDRGRDA